MTSEQQQKSTVERRETYSYGTQRSHHYAERSSQTHAAFFTPYLQAGLALVDGKRSE